MAGTSCDIRLARPGYRSHPVESLVHVLALAPGAGHPSRDRGLLPHCDEIRDIRIHHETGRDHFTERLRLDGCLIDGGPIHGRSGRPSTSWTARAASGSITYCFEARDLNIVLAPPVSGAHVRFDVRLAR